MRNVGGYIISTLFSSPKSTYNLCHKRKNHVTVTWKNVFSKKNLTEKKSVKNKKTKNQIKNCKFCWCI